MTETTTTQEHPDGRLCPVGSKGDNPCWRQATERARLGEDRLYCPEHAQLRRVVDERDEMLEDLDALHTMVRQTIAPSLHGKADSPNLERRLWEILEEMLREYLRHVIVTRAAEIIAQQGEGEEPLKLEEALSIARRLILSDAYTDARAILLDAPDDVFHTRDRWLLVASLMEAPDLMEVSEGDKEA